MIVDRPGLTFEYPEPGRAPRAGRCRLLSRTRGVSRRVEDMPDAVRDQLSNRAPASGGLDLQASIEEVVKLDGGFHENKVTS